MTAPPYTVEFGYIGSSESGSDQCSGTSNSSMTPGTAPVICDLMGLTRHAHALGERRVAAHTLSDRRRADADGAARALQGLAEHQQRQEPGLAPVGQLRMRGHAARLPSRATTFCGFSIGSDAPLEASWRTHPPPPSGIRWPAYPSALVADEAFIVMQIGNAELDAVSEEVIKPAITAAGLIPRRVDQHNQGDLLKSEIVHFIERSLIIVADVTNERPNCYLEIGYAMGLGKKPNLILTCREDHHHGSPHFRRDGPKVHFDLEGYDILFWDPDDLSAFRAELGRRITRRVGIVSRPPAAAGSGAEAGDWQTELRARGERRLDEEFGLRGYMEVTASIRPTGDWSQSALNNAVTHSEILTFGWSVAPVLFDERRPRPTNDGVEAEVVSTTMGPSYDLWKVFRDGRFYTLMSLFEDRRGADLLWWDSRVHRVTESLQFLVRLYRHLEASDTDQITVNVRHAGLSGRTLGVANQMRMSHPRSTTEEVSEAEFTATLIELETDPFTYVKRILEPLFMVFEFFEPDDKIVRDIVDNYLQGKVV